MSNRKNSFNRSIARTFFGLSCLCAVLGLMLTNAAAAAGQQTDVYTARARALVAKMTLDEKLASIHGMSDSHHFRYVPGIPRLGIPPLAITNGPAGVGPGGSNPQLRATALPAPISLAASWDVDLARRYGVLAAQEAQDLGSNLLEAPDVNIIRVPQGGRSFECFTEDPFLNSQLAVANIKGIQSVGVLANVKHYIANNQEFERHFINEIVGERALREIYMPAFEASVREADVASVMCAHPKVNGSYSCENGPLLNDVLKAEWHFKGFVLSDFGAVNSTIPSALNGLDLEMPTGKYFSTALKTAVEQGAVPVSAIDNMLIRRYSVMMRFGLFSSPAKRRPVPILEDGRLARDMAAQGMVLLKNESNLLPLDQHSVRSIALIGPDAVHAKSGGGGSSHVVPFYSIEPPDAIFAHMASSFRNGEKHVVTLDGSDIEAAVAAAKKAEVAIVMVGDYQSEDHPASLSLPDADNRLIQAVAGANPKTIVVLKSGSALLMPWLNAVPAVLEAWYPGEEDGNAIAEVLFGDVNPSGKLPITFPANADDTLASNPAYYPGLNHSVQYGEGLEVGYRWYQIHKIKPLFPFGYGLSYTTFSFSGLKVTRGSDVRHTAQIQFHLTNTGQRAGAEVAQVYVGFPNIPEGNEAPMQLKGFQKIMLQPGQTRTVTMLLSPRDFSYWSEKDHRWQVLPGTYVIQVGSSSEDLPLMGKILVE